MRPTTALAATAAALTLLAPGVHAKTPRPDLRVASVSMGAGTTAAGQALRLGDTTRNARSGARARATVNAYFLSADRRRSRGDFKFAGRRVKRLARGRASRGTTSGVVPRSLPPGNWFVIACADFARVVRESNERNNCAASRMTVAVTAPGGAPGGGAPANPNPPVISGCQILPADNPWNRDISQDPVDPLSDTYIRYMGSTPGADWNLRQDWGTGEEPFYGIPWVVVPPGQALLPISFSSDGAPDESDKGPFPFPPDIPIEGGSPSAPDPSDGDRHAIALQQGGDCTLYETFATTRQRSGGSVSGFEVYSAARFDLGSNALRPATWTSADAAGLPIFPGLAKHQEVAAGAINHALRFTVPRVQKSYIAPATHYGTQENACYPPYGTRVRLKASFDMSRLTGQARVIGEALRTYGLMLADQGSAGYISGTSDPGWDMDEIRQLREIHGTDLEVVATGPITPYDWTPPASPSC